MRQGPGATWGEDHTAGTTRCAPLAITIDIDGTVVAEGTVPMSALTFTVNDCLDIGKALGSAVWLDYRTRASFEFNGHIEHVHVCYPEAG